MKWTYEIRCIEAVGEDIGDMVDTELTITRRTFRRYVDHANLAALEAELGYDKHPKQGLTMAGDWHVSYHRSTYQGRPCVYFAWSGIEHVFTDPETRP